MTVKSLSGNIFVTCRHVHLNGAVIKAKNEENPLNESIPKTLQFLKHRVKKG